MSKTTGPPLHWNSTTSSPVKLFGDLKKRQIPSSIICPYLFLKGQYSANLFLGYLSKINFAISSAESPETLIIPIPPFPIAVEIAAIVSCFIFVFLNKTTPNRLLYGVVFKDIN